MEDLTKQQIVLLTLLVSFITSMATGIITVALMNQVPQTMTQTINRVVERTIEKVVPTDTVNTQTVVTKETIVVKEEDKIVESIGKNSDSIVRIYKAKTDGETSDTFVSVGVIISEDGNVATDNYGIYSASKYVGVLPDGTQRDLNIVRSENNEKVAILKFASVDGDKQSTYKSASLSSSVPQLGQTVIFIGGDTKNSVFTGIISSVYNKDTKTTVPVEPNASSTATTTEKIVKVLSALDTNLSSQSLTSGGPLLNLSGEIVGIKVFSSEGEKSGLFVPSTIIKNIFESPAVLKTS
jgi:S1-C subfamily serine protease